MARGGPGRERPCCEAHTLLWSSVRREQVGEGVLIRGGRGMKPQHAVRVLGEHAVEHERMRVHVDVERGPETLDDGHGSAPAVGDAVRSGPPPQEPEHGAHEHPDHTTTARMIPCHHVPEMVRNRQDPLTDRNRRKDGCDVVSHRRSQPSASSVSSDLPSHLRVSMRPLPGGRTQPTVASTSPPRSYGCGSLKVSSQRRATCSGAGLAIIGALVIVGLAART